MTGNEDMTAFSSLTQTQQIVFLASYAHCLTMAARDTYVPGEDTVADPCRLRRMNEIQHRVTAHLLHLLNDNPERYPDDGLMSIILDDNDPELMWAFKQALKTIEETS